MDNAATTKVSEAVAGKINDMMCGTYGNPSSKHRKGFDAEQEIKSAAKSIAGLCKCKEKEIYYTSGGTESNNLALIGTAMANKRRGRHIVTSQIEHPSVTEPLKFLEQQGFEVTYLPVDFMGKIKEDILSEAVREDTILVSVIYVNNEIGSVQNISGISKRIRTHNPNIIFHTDAVQAFGKYRIIPEREGIDLLSASAHKLHGPKGTGFLYIKEGTKIQPLFYGGGQQKSVRPGTENVPGIAGMALAGINAYQDRENKAEAMFTLKENFIRSLKQELNGIRINACECGSIRETAPHVVSVCFEQIKSEVLLHALEDRGIYVSSGSACSSNHQGFSSVLRAIGVEENLLDSTLRFSFSDETTQEELEYTVKQLKEILPVLRKYRRM